MSLDPSLALQVQPLKVDNPLDSAGKALTLRQLMLQNAAGQQTFDDNQKLRSIYQQGGTDPATLRDLLYKGGFADKALALDKDVLANKSATAEIGQKNAQTQKYMNELRAQLAGSIVNTPAEQRAAVYPAMAARWNALGLSATGDGQPGNPAPAQWSDDLFPHLQTIALSGLDAKDSAARADQTRAAAVDQQPALNGPDLPGATQAPLTLRQPNMTQPQGVPLPPDDLPAPPNEAPSPTADRIHPTTTVTAQNGVSSPNDLRAKADLLDKQGTAVAAARATDFRTRADALEARIQAQAKEAGELVEIGDPTSSTGSRYVLKSEAAGQPGSKILSAPKTQISIKTSEELNKDFIGNEYRPTIQTANTAKSSNNQIQTLRNLDITGKSGWGADTQAKAASVLAAFGVKDAAKYAGDAQVFNATAGQKIFEVLAAQKGTQTEGDAARAKQLFVNLGNTPDANKFLLDLGQATNNMAIKKADYYLTHRGEHKDDLGQLESEWFNASKDQSIWNDPVMKKWANKGAQSAPASDPNIDALIKKWTK